MDIEMEEPAVKPHETCVPADGESGPMSWCAFHNQQLGFCQAEMQQGATEPTRQKTKFQQRLEQIAQLPPGFRVMVVISDPLSNLSVQVLDPTDNGFATWELMGIVEFIRTQMRLAASQQITQSDSQQRYASEEDEPQTTM